MTKRITLDPSLDAGPVTIEAEPLTISLEQADICTTPGHAIAAAVARGIRSVSERAERGKGRKWNRTGTLARGIRADVNRDGSVDVVPPSGRLERDGELVEELREDVAVLRNPLADEDVRAAVQTAVHGLFTVGTK